MYVVEEVGEDDLDVSSSPGSLTCMMGCPISMLAGSCLIGPPISFGNFC